MPSNTKTRKLKTTDAAPSESSDPNNVPIWSLYPEPETKTEDNPKAPAWFIMANKRLIPQAPVQSCSVKSPTQLLVKIIIQTTI